MSDIVFDHPLPWLVGLLTGVLATTTAAIATRVALLPDVIDISIVPSAAGVGGLLADACGAFLRFGPERLARGTLVGNLLGAVVAALGLALVLVIDVLP